MSDKPNEMTAPAVVEFTRHLFRSLAEWHGGDCTLNELRIMNQVILCRLKGRTCCVSALHRVIANLQSDGWISER